MKRVLLDHCVPRKIRHACPHCEVLATHPLGWSRLRNGALLHAAELAAFDVFLTADKNLRYQQNLAARKIAIVVLPTNQLVTLLPLFPMIEAAVARATPGSFEEIPLPLAQLFHSRVMKLSVFSSSRAASTSVAFSAGVPPFFKVSSSSAFAPAASFCKSAACIRA